MYGEPTSPPLRVLSRQYEVWLADLARFPVKLVRQYAARLAHVADLLCYSVSPCCRTVLHCQPMLPTFCVILSAHVADFLCYSVSPCCRLSVTLLAHVADFLC